MRKLMAENRQLKAELEETLQKAIRIIELTNTQLNITQNRI